MSVWFPDTCTRAKLVERKSGARERESEREDAKSGECPTNTSPILSYTKKHAGIRVSYRLALVYIATLMTE